MWLASCALRDKTREIVGTFDWSPAMMEYAQMQLRTSGLGGVGDPSRQRCFRMNISLCLHRAVTPRELRLAPRWWHETNARDIAGAPIEIMWAVGLPENLTAQPCANPRRDVVIPSRPDLWAPRDCGVCPSCVARATQQSKSCQCVLCLTQEASTTRLIQEASTTRLTQEASTTRLIQEASSA